MREPDDIPVVGAMNYYQESLDLSENIGIREEWDRIFMPIYRRLEVGGMGFERRVRVAAEQTNQHFEMKVNAGINEHDYV